jgi:hypothetical protein
MTKKLILFTIGTIGIIFLGLIIFGISVMGDRFCKVQLLNHGQKSIGVKTVRSTGNEWTMVVDSLALGPNDKFDIGSCINCSSLKPTDFDFDALVLFQHSKPPKLIHRKDLVDYLDSLERVDCATFIVR